MDSPQRGLLGHHCVRSAPGTTAQSPRVTGTYRLSPGDSVKMRFRNFCPPTLPSFQASSPASSQTYSPALFPGYKCHQKPSQRGTWEAHFTPSLSHARSVGSPPLLPVTSLSKSTSSRPHTHQRSPRPCLESPWPGLPRPGSPCSSLHLSTGYVGVKDPHLPGPQLFAERCDICSRCPAASQADGNPLFQAQEAGRGEKHPDFKTFCVFLSQAFVRSDTGWPSSCNFVILPCVPKA